MRSFGIAASNEGGGGETETNKKQIDQGTHTHTEAKKWKEGRKGYLCPPKTALFPLR